MNESYVFLYENLRMMNLAKFKFILVDPVHSIALLCQIYAHHIMKSNLIFYFCIISIKEGFCQEVDQVGPLRTRKKNTANLDP